MAGRIPVQLCPHLFLGLWGTTTHRWVPLPGFEFHWTPLFPSTPPGSPLAESAASLLRLLLPGLAAVPGLKLPPGFSLGMGLGGSNKQEGHLGAQTQAWPQVPDLTSLGCFIRSKPQRGLGGMAGPLSPGQYGDSGGHQHRPLPSPRSREETRAPPNGTGCQG